MHNKIRNFIFGNSPLILRFTVYILIVVFRAITLPITLVLIALLKLIKEIPNDLRSFAEDIKYGYNRMMKNDK